MTPDERWLTQSLIAECDRVRFNEPWSVAQFDLRITLAQKVQREVSSTDARALAVVEVARALEALCWDTDQAVVLRFLAARRAYVAVLQREFDGA